VENPDEVVSWQWEVKGTPCDRLFQNLPGSTATSTNGELSYTLNNADQQNAAIDFTLSGNYEVTLTAEFADGSSIGCTWIVQVKAPGLRVELCWDETGPTASSPRDMDLHLGRQGTTFEWFDGDTDCYFGSCQDNTPDPFWGYEDSPIDNCTGPGARGDFVGSCPNPRLDIDNIFQGESYVPENINLDNPRDGDRFRVMVHHWDSNDVAVQPLVNVYCGGELRGSFGQAPDVVMGFDEGGGRCGGDMWHVTDVLMEVDDAGTTTGCRLRPIFPPDGAPGDRFIPTDICTYDGIQR
jgi:hypothetical protein